MKLFGVFAAACAASAFRTTARVAERPVMKVVRLLQDMKAELEKEKTDDDAVYEQLSCWCSTNEKEKTSAIEAGTAKMDDLKADLGEYAAKIEELRTGLAQTREKLQADQKALDTATALRMKENKAFHSEETSLLDAIQSCKQAIVVLSKHNPSLEQVRTVYKSLLALKNLQTSGDSTLSRDSLAEINAFIQQGNNIPGFQDYAPQSGQIFGVLRQMQEDFEGDLDHAQKEEARRAQEFEDLRAAKQEELASGQKQLQQLEKDDADFREKNAQAYEELQNTREQVEIDQEFLRKLKKTCETTDAEFEARTKGRLAEIAAVEDTIAYLNTDAAFDVFGKTVGASGPVLLQTSRGDVVRRGRAQGVLRRAGNPRLVLLAAELEIDSFTKVKAAIDKMVAELMKQNQEEVKQQSYCTEEIHTNELAEKKAEDKKEYLQTKIADLEKSIKEFKKEIKECKKECDEMEAQMKKASEIREGEAGEYHQTIVDQRVTQAILQKAIDRLSQVYGFVQEPNQPGAAHVALSGTDTDPSNGPARFTKYEKSASGGRILSMLGEILGDSKKMEDEAMAAEQDAQFSYESFMKDSNRALTAAARGIVNMDEDTAKAEEALGLAKADLDSTVKELENLNGVLGDLHKSCDFVLLNFDARQEARTNEINALNEAKAILSGMK